MSPLLLSTGERLWGRLGIRCWRHGPSNQVFSCRSRIVQQAMSSSVYTSSTASTASSVSPRSKRLNYADAEKFCSSVNCAAPSSYCRPLSDHADSISAVLSHVDSTAPHASLRIRLQQRWMTVLLRLMRTPYLGALTMRALEAAAYMAYVKGSVTIFTRRRVGPPVAGVVESELSFDDRKLCQCSRTAHSQASQSHRDDNMPNGDARSTSPHLTSTTAPSAPHAAWRTLSHGSSFGEEALDCLYVGDSPIHSRGLFTTRALRRGTRVIAERRRSLLLAPHFVTLLADTHERLPDTWHYTQPTGSVVELVTQAQPHHLMNHSCRANVCSGLSPIFWEAAAMAGAWQQTSQLRNVKGGCGSGGGERGGGPCSSCVGEGDDEVLGSPSSSVEAAPPHNVNWMERLTLWPFFADANSFFVTRDVEAGEELTLNYSARMAPLYAGDSTSMPQSRNWLLCQCGQSCCRHYVYRPTPDVHEFLRALQSGRYVEKRSTQLTGRHSLPSMSEGAAVPNAPAIRDTLHVMAKLLQLGFDDELVLLSYAASSADVVAYVYGQPLPSLQKRSTAPQGVSFAPLHAPLVDAPSTVEEGISVELRRVTKRQLLLDYRYVFRLLNERAPLRA